MSRGRRHLTMPPQEQTWDDNSAPSSVGEAHLDDFLCEDFQENHSRRRFKPVTSAVKVPASLQHLPPHEPTLINRQCNADYDYDGDGEAT